MLGAIIGDIVGSRFEYDLIKTKDFELLTPECRFTDDTALTVAVADALLKGGEYAKCLERYYYHYPNVPYGIRFLEWAEGHTQKPYNSWGNGSAMRVSPVAYARNTLDEVLTEAKASAEVTHNHPEGIKGAQATAAAIFLGRTGKTKKDIKDFVEKSFDYDLDRKLDDIREDYYCDLSCQHTVPEAIISFLESESFEDAIRNAVSLGGDPDTMACITGSIAEAFYGGVPAEIETTIRENYLDERMLGVIDNFRARYPV